MGYVIPAKSPPAKAEPAGFNADRSMTARSTGMEIHLSLGVSTLVALMAAHSTVAPAVRRRGAVAKAGARGDTCCCQCARRR